MREVMHMPWLSHTITVVDSPDPSLIGLRGTVLDETRRTIRVLTENGRVRLAKDVITFVIDSGEVIDGSAVTQRPEDRINRRYRGH